MEVVGPILNLVLIGGVLLVVGPALLGALTKAQAGGAVVPTVPGTTTPPATTGNPLQDALNSLIAALQGGTGGTTPTTPGQVYVDPTTGQVVTVPGGTTAGANPSLCHSQYNGKCDTECKGGNSSNCTNCKIACGLTSNFATAYSAIYDDMGMPLPIGWKVTSA